MNIQYYQKNLEFNYLKRTLPRGIRNFFGFKSWQGSTNIWPFFDIAVNVRKKTLESSRLAIPLSSSEMRFIRALSDNSQIDLKKILSRQASHYVFKVAQSLEEKLSAVSGQCGLITVPEPGKIRLGKKIRIGTY